jgi:signal transduction histidine kinase
MHSPPPIRTKLLRILLVPLISMVVLWGFIAYSNADELVGANRFDDRWLTTGAPALRLAEELQDERRVTAETLGRAAPEVAAQRKATDEAVRRLRQAVTSDPALTESTRAAAARMRRLLRPLESLPQLRAQIDEGRLSSPYRIVEAYSGLIEEVYRSLGNRDPEGEVANVPEIRAATSYVDSAEYLAREHALLAAALRAGSMSGADRAAFVAAFTARRDALAAALRDAGPYLRPAVDELTAGVPYKRITQVEDRVLAWDGTGRPPAAAQWRDDVEAVTAAIRQGAMRELARATDEQEVLRTRAAVVASLILLLGAGAVALSIFLSYRFTNSAVAEFRRLQEAAARMARERLPRVVERLRKGEDVDVEEEAPELPPADTAEFDEVVKSFTAVQRTALEAAVGQATLRKGIAQVFLNLAWRNQVLLQRQLTLLDAMERRVEEPDILEDLFRLDHLTTRMRRHAENLIILADAAPARRWRDPVPLYDLVRSAVLEVEDYTRVTVAPMPDAPMLVGSAVTDVIHLVAELVENATVFSPPDTTVTVRGTKAANGFALEIEDRGLGLNPAMLEELNARLADPPEFDLADSDRLGLFVVARLANRHNIKVRLRPSPYDGTTAIVMLPTTLLATPEMADPGRPAPAAEAGRDLRARRPLRALSTVPETRAAPVAAATAPAPPGEAPSSAALTTDTAIPTASPAAGAPAAASRGGPAGRPPQQAPAGPPNGQAAAPGPARPAPGGPPRPSGGERQRPSGPAATAQGPAGGPGPASPGPWPQGAGAPAVFPAPPPPPAESGGRAAEGTGSGYRSPWFEPERPRPPAGPGAFPSPPPAPAPEPADDDDDDLDGLPRRIPQASLAPQLRRRLNQDEVTSRSPEELRRLMSAMQHGWRQGRRVVEQAGGATPGPETGHPASRPGVPGEGTGGHPEQGRGQTEQGHDMWIRKDGNPDVRPEN